MPLVIVRNDITKMKVDAIVNAANHTLLGGGGVDGAIHRAAGPGLLEECRALGGCGTGEAKITGAYNLPCRYVIHTVGPVWRGGGHGERDLLISCYRSSLALAEEHGCETVAFPLISSGAFGYPKDRALEAAVEAIGAFLSGHDMTVAIVVYDKGSYRIGRKLFADISQYIDDHYVKEVPYKRGKRPSKLSADEAPVAMAQREFFEFRESAPVSPASRSAFTLNEAVSMIDESFSEMLLRKIDERGITDAQCYKKANIDRKLFSKIRGDRQYRPSKPTVLAFAIALELPLDETREMLMKAGFALSHSNKFDIIVEFFISRGNYNIFEINEALFAFDQSLLGA